MVLTIVILKFVLTVSLKKKITVADLNSLTPSFDANANFSLSDIMATDNLDVWLDLLSNPAGTTQGQTANTQSIPNMGEFDNQQLLFPQNNEFALDNGTSPFYNPSAEMLPLFPTLPSPASTNTDAQSNTAAINPKLFGKAALAFDTPKSAVSQAEPKKRKMTKEDIEKLTEEELLQLKRAKNNEAARKSRERKVKRLEDLEQLLAKSEGEKNELQLKVAIMESEKNTWLARERELVHRILSLETQLNESHMALIKTGKSMC